MTDLIFTILSGPSFTLLLPSIITILGFTTSFFMRSSFNEKPARAIWSILVVIIGCAIFSYFIVSQPSSNNLQPAEKEDMSEKITSISNSLSELAREISNVQQELESRIETVENLKRQAEEAENYLSFTEQQVAVMHAALSRDEPTNSIKTVLLNLLSNAIWFLAGFASRYIMSWIKRKKGAGAISAKSDVQDEHN